MATRPGATPAPRILILACDHVRYPPLGGELHTENGCRHGKYLKMRRYSEGLCCSFLLGFLHCDTTCLLHRTSASQRHFWAGPSLACACHSLVRLPCCSRWCAHPLAVAPTSHPLLNYLARNSSLTLSPLSLSTSLSYSPLPSVSPSHRTLTPEHARFNITSASSGRKHRGHSLPCLFFHPPTFPLGTAPCTA